ncbi:DinB family protein [Fibrisoma montanum]|uniref:DinB family protein n=1 Tax=Fibrisoma montanum TaxID=2305895 RepID=A0A418M337_9BACT|nr:DinB family protein [Fibrisoma montanum]RIV19949.1 DinB family protein [Fibrisoma montanum]
MKQRLILLSLLMLVITTSYAQKNFWTETDRRYTVDNLKRTRDELTRETEHLTDAQWHFHESPDRWSIAEVVEHLALWEIIWAREIGMGIRNTARPDLIATSRPDSYYHDFIMENKAHKSSDLSRPTGFIQGKNNLTFFQRLRDQAITFADTTQADMRAQFELTATPSPRNMHQVYIYQWGHVDRHLRQIRKIKQHPNYPKETALKK